MVLTTEAQEGGRGWYLDLSGSTTKKKLFLCAPSLCRFLRKIIYYIFALPIGMRWTAVIHVKLREAIKIPYINKYPLKIFALNEIRNISIFLLSV